VARRVLAALSECDLDGFSRLLDPEVEIHTARGVRRGAEAATRWAGRRFEHLERRYVVEELRDAEDTVLALTRVQYVWRDDQKLGGEWLLGIVLDLRDGKLLRWRVFDDPMDALEELEA
jgi:ketosteroid isomerase-like protein